MFTAHELITKTYEDVIDKQSRVMIRTVKLDNEGKPVVYLKAAEEIAYDHKHKRVVIK